jgi:hypothetical protein
VGDSVSEGRTAVVLARLSHDGASKYADRRSAD